MANYSIAGLTVKILSRYDHLPRLCAAFLCSEDALPDITVCVTDEDILAERQACPGAFSDGYIESVCAYRKLCLQMPEFGGMFLHCSFIRAEEKGIAFLAASGTGKTTHTALWQQLLGEKVTVINGDKPILRQKDGLFFGYGTPWAGKEGVYAKDSAALTDLCFLERSEVNTCTPLTREEALRRIVHQVIFPEDAAGTTKTLQLLDALLKGCRLWLIRCNMDLQAAQVAYDTICK